MISKRKKIEEEVPGGKRGVPEVRFSGQEERAVLTGFCARPQDVLQN